MSLQRTPTRALAGAQTSLLSWRENQGKYVELAISILQAPLTEQSAGVRTWAADVLNRYSGVPLSEQTKEDLVRTGALKDARKVRSEASQLDTPARILQASVPDSMVHLPFSPPAVAVTVPDLLRLNLAQARELVHRVGLNLKEMSLASPNDPNIPNEQKAILSQDPRAGSGVPPNSTVQVMARRVVVIR